MEDFNVMLTELKGLMGKTDQQSEKRRDEIAQWVKEHNTPEIEKQWCKFIEDGLAEIKSDTEVLRRQIEDEDYRLLPLSYIAKHYFGKSQAWLSQRINGSPVRGKVYTLNAEQKQIFNNALKDIGKKIGSFQIT